MIDILNQRVQKSPEKKFIEYNNDSITYRKFNNIVNNLIRTIESVDEKNNYIGLQINNKLKLLALIIAINRYKKIPVVYPDYPNIQDYIKNTNIPIVFRDGDITLDSKNVINKTKIAYNPDATQLVIFTSGTMGRPKACRLTYNNIYQSALKWNVVIKFHDKDIYLNHMPIIHVSGLCVFFRSLYNNFKMILTNFNSNNYFNYIKNNKINFISMVPSMLQKIIENNPQSKIPQSLKAVIIGGSEMSAKVSDIIATYQIPAYISYGMSETTSGIAGFWYNQNHSQRYVAHNNIGINLYKSQIIITGDTVMKGYLNDRNIEGKFRSNDIGEIYSDGSFKIKKRKDLVSNYGGESVSVEYVKKRIERYSMVEQCTLKIVKDNQWGEILHAYIKLNKDIDSNILLNKMKKDLPKYMIPKKIIKQ